MPRFKRPHAGLKLIPVDFERQVLPGTFEHALCYLIDHEVDLSGLEARYRNEASGAPAFLPAVLLKIVLLAYSRGLVSSRAIERACRECVLFKRAHVRRLFHRLDGWIVRRIWSHRFRRWRCRGWHALPST